MNIKVLCRGGQTFLFQSVTRIDHIPGLPLLTIFAKTGKDEAVAGQIAMAEIVGWYNVDAAQKEVHV